MKHFVLAIPIVATLFYQTGLKNIQQNLHPVVVLISVYSAALIGLLVFACFACKPGEFCLPEAVNIRHLAFVCIGILGAELGYLFIYRLGGELAKAPVLVYSLSTVLLALIAKFIQREKLNSMTVLGIVLTLTGVIALTNSKN